MVPLRPRLELEKTTLKPGPKMFGFAEFRSRFGGTSYQWPVNLLEERSAVLRKFVTDNSAPTTEAEAEDYLLAIEPLVRELAPLGSATMRFVGFRVIENDVGGPMERMSAGETSELTPALERQCFSPFEPVPEPPAE